MTSVVCVIVIKICKVKNGESKSQKLPKVKILHIVVKFRINTICSIKMTKNYHEIFVLSVRRITYENL
jgi:hypothetical protein